MRRRAFVSGLAGLGAATFLGSCTTQATPRVRRIGYLSANARTQFEIETRPFFEKLRDLGRIEGRDMVVDIRISDGAQDRLPAMAAELVALPVDVILAEGGPAHFAAKRATSTIPVVLVVGPDPVAAGLVASLARPGGNVTAVSMDPIRVNGKKLELLKDTVPGLKRVAVIYRSDNTTIESAHAAQEAAPALGLEAEIFGARDVKELDAVLDQIARGRFHGMMLTPLLTVVRDDHSRIPEFAARSQLPQIYGDVQIVRAGGLMYYGPNWPALYRAAAVLVDRILKGADPADLPVALPTQFDLAINLTMARRIGVTFPQSVLRQATEVIP